MTIEHSDIVDGERHEPKGIDVAAAGQVYVADGAGSGSWGTAEAEGPARRIYINEISDFRTDEAITNLATYTTDQYYQLQNNTEYFISSSFQNPVVLDYGLRFGEDSILNGAAPTLANLSCGYSDFGDNILNSALQAIGTNVSINNIQVIGAGIGTHTRGLYIDTDYSGTPRFYILDNFITDGHILGADIDIGPQCIYSHEGAFFSSCTNGIIFRDNTESATFGSGTIGFEQGLFSGITGTAIDLTALSAGAAIGSVSFASNNVTFVCGAGASAITTNALGADIQANSLGTVKECQFIAAGPGATFWGGAGDQNDLRWSVMGNVNIPDSITAGRVFSDASSSIAMVTNTEVAIDNSTQLENGMLKRFDMPADSQIRYIDERESFCTVIADVTGQAASGTNNALITVQKNWSGDGTGEIIASKGPIELESARDSSYTLSGFACLQQNDTLHLIIERTVGSSTFECSSCAIKVVRSAAG